MNSIDCEVVVETSDGVTTNVNDASTLQEAEMLLDFAMGDDTLIWSAPHSVDGPESRDNPHEMDNLHDHTHDDDVENHDEDEVEDHDNVNSHVEEGTNPATDGGKENKKKRTQKLRQMKSRSYAAEGNMLKRSRGEAYEGVQRIEGQKVNVIRNPRVCGLACTNPRCVKTKRACTSMTAEARTTLFEHYWSLSQQEKGVYIRAHVDKLPPKKHCGDRFLSKQREFQFKYYLKENGIRREVCFSFFLKTLGIKESQCRDTITNTRKTSTFTVPRGPALQPLLGNASENATRVTSEAYSNAKLYYSQELDKLPKLESHLSRSTSEKLYLQHDFNSIREVHRFLSKEAEKAHIHKLTWPAFLELFQQKKLAIHRLKKDLCDRCVKFDLKRQAKSLTAEDAALYEQHREDVTRNREERLADKKLDKTLFLVAVCDVEKLLQCPRLKNGKQYYLCKLQIKNWTAYDLLTSDVICKLFDETQGGSDGSIYASLLCCYIEGKIIESPTITTAIIWSDGCASQNRCVLVSNALLHLAMRLKICIIQKYLIPGHSQNEVDSAHARIESSTKELTLYSPAQFADAIRKARLSEENGGRRGITPYRVEMVTYDEFFNFEAAKIYSSISPGYKSGDPTVMNVRALAYHPDGKMQFKLSFNDQWSDMPHRIEHPSNLVRKKYTEPIPLTASKFRDLQKLKEFIPEEYHEFYDLLPHN